MSDLKLVAAAISSVINFPVKTHDECANFSDSQILDLDAVHKHSIRQGVEGNVFRQGEPDSRQGVEVNPDAEILPPQPDFRQGDEVNPDSNILPPQPIQIFFKTSFGKSHSMLVLPNSNVLELKQAIQKKLYIGRPISLGFASKILNDRKTLESYNIKRGDTIHVLFRLRGGFEYYVIKDDFLDSRFNYDFTHTSDDGKTYIRGEETYERPCGWKRFALNVGKKYGPNDEWLGSSGNPNEWPVSYHGTKKDFVDSIAENGYLLDKGKRFLYGKGIYSTPKVKIAESYASEFNHEGFDYKLIFQNRVNPTELNKVNTGHGPYWITTDEMNIRPYGLCIKRV